MRGLPIKYRRHVMEKTGAVVDEPSTLIFERLKEAVELRIVAVKNLTKQKKGWWFMRGLPIKFRRHAME